MPDITEQEKDILLADWEVSYPREKRIADRKEYTQRMQRLTLERLKGQYMVEPKSKSWIDQTTSIDNMKYSKEGNDLAAAYWKEEYDQVMQAMNDMERMRNGIRAKDSQNR